jgi:hypothetical protein
VAAAARASQARHHPVRDRPAAAEYEAAPRRAAGTRAVLEGVTFAFRDSRDALAATGTKLESLLAVGGGAKSDYWLKAIAITHYHNISFDENYFVEWLVVPDKDYYFPLLENYYKANEDTKSAAVFYHLIQCTYLAEQQEWGTFEDHFKQVIPLLVSTFSFNSILKMRWLGIQLYHDSHFNNGDLQKSIIKRIFSATYINEKDNGNSITAIFIISNYLTHLELYDVIIELYEQKCLKRTSLLGHWGYLNLNQLNVHYALALLKTGKNQEAKLIFDKIKHHQFDLNFKTRMLALYDVLVKELK